MNRILLIIFILLLVITSGEIFYFLTTKDTTNREIALQSGKNTVTSTSGNQDNRYPTTSVAYASALLESKQLATSTLTNTYKGKVKEITFKPGEYTYKNGVRRAYKRMILIIGNDGYHGNYFFYNDHDASLMKFEQDGELQPLAFNTVKVGDDILIKEILDLTKGTEEMRTAITVSKI